SLRARSPARASSSNAKRSSPSMTTRPSLGTSRPAISPSSVDLPEPEAPTMAADSRACRVKPTSWRMVSVPVESVTRLVRCSTAMMGSDMRVLAFFVRWHCSLWLAAAVALCSALSCPAAMAAPAKLLVVGDSLSAEYGLARGGGWVALLSEKLQREKFAVEVVNASISGDTTAGGRARLPALLKTHQPQVVVIELGGNDALRGLPVAQTRDNLEAMAKAARAAGAKVLLAGMQVPPNYGRQYTADFAK